MKLIILLCSSLFTFTVGWKPKQQLTFTIEGRNLAGLPELKNQFTGVDFNGTLLLQTHDPTTFLLKFSNMTFTKLHGDFESWWDSDENVEAKTKQLPMSSSPFVIQLQKNVVKKIIVPSNLKDWELNFVKGIVNQLILSVNINSDTGRSSDNSVPKSKTSSGEKTITSYTTVEDSVVGRCEVQYDIVKIPQGSEGLGDLWNYPMKKSVCGRNDLYEVTKTYNYSNCEFLAETHYNFPSSRVDPNCRPGSGSCENFWKMFQRSTLTRAVGCSDPNGFVLMDSVTTSTMSANIQIRDESRAVIHSKLNISLSKVEPEQNGGFRTSISKNVKHVNEFTYTYTPRRWDALTSSSCNSNIREQISGQNEESKKISELLFNSFNDKSKDKENRRSKRSKVSKSKKSKNANKNDGDENKFDHEAAEFDNVNDNNDDNERNYYDDRSNKERVNERESYDGNKYDNDDYKPNYDDNINPNFDNRKLVNEDYNKPKPSYDDNINRNLNNRKVVNEDYSKRKPSYDDNINPNFDNCKVVKENNERDFADREKNDFSNYRPKNNGFNTHDLDDKNYDGQTSNDFNKRRPDDDGSTNNNRDIVEDKERNYDDKSNNGKMNERDYNSGSKYNYDDYTPNFYDGIKPEPVNRKVVKEYNERNFYDRDNKDYGDYRPKNDGLNEYNFDDKNYDGQNFNNFNKPKLDDDTRSKYNGDAWKYNERNYDPNSRDNYGKIDNVNEYHDEYEKPNYGDSNKNNYDGAESSEKNFWNPEPAGMHDPPFMPMTPFAISHKEPDVRNCLEQIFKDLIEQITHDFTSENVLVEEGTMEKISIAVDMCQIMTFKELSRVSDALFYGSTTNQTTSDISQAKRNLFRDIVAACGTRPALSMIGKWIDNNQLGSDEGAVIFTSLPARLLSGDKNTVNFYFELAKKLSNKKNEKLAIAAVISFSNFVRVTCIKRKSKENHFNPHVEDLCDSKDAENYVSWMANKLKYDNKKMFRVYSLAIGNTGSRSAIKILKSIANNSDLSSYQRSSAVIAMKYLTIYYPTHTEPALFSIYSNYSAPVSVRIAALSTLIFSQPSLTIWQRIAISTWYEPNFAVMSFIQSTISTLSNAYHQNPEIHKEMARSAALVQHLMRPETSYPQKPVVYNILESSFMKEMEQAVFEHSSWIGSADSMSIYHRHYTLMSAFSTNYEAEFSTANPDGLLSSLKFLIFPPNDDITQARPPIQDLKRSTSWIRSKLGLTPRNPSPLEGDIHFKINNLIESIIPFDRKTSVSFAVWGKEFLSRLRGKGIVKNIQKTDMSSIALSTATELGLPVRLQIRVPWVLQSKTSMKLIDTDSMNVSFSLKFSSGMNGEFSFFTPWDNTAYIAGIYGSCFGQIPKIKFSTELDRETSSLIIKTDDIDESKLLFHSTYPFTSQKDLITNQLISNSAETRIVHVSEMKQKNLNPCPQLTGVYRTEGKMYNTFEAFNQLKLNHHPVMWHSNKLTHIEIRMKKMGPSVFNFTLDSASVDEGNISVHKIMDNYNYEKENAKYNKPKKQVTRSIWSAIKEKLFGGGSEEETTTTEAPTTTTSPETETTTYTTEVPTTDYSTTPSMPYSGSNKMDYESDKVKFEKVTYNNDGQIFNASTVDPFVNQVNGSSQLYVISKVLDGMNSGQAVVIGLNATINTSEGDVKQYSTFWAYATTNSKNLQRIGYFVNASDWQNGFTATLESPSLPGFDLEKVVKGDTQPNFTVDFVQQQNAHTRTWSAQGVITQKASVIDSQKEIEECQRPKTAASSKCRRLHRFLTSFSEMKLNVKVNNEGNSNEMTLSNFADFATVVGRNYLTGHNSNRTRNVGDESGDLSDQLQLSVSTNKYSTLWNLWINTSSFDSNFTNIPWPYKPMMSSALTVYEELTQINSQYCGITNNKILTFDGLELNYNMSDCWHVAVKDCSGKNRIVILTRALTNSSFLDLEINLDNYKIVTISEEGIFVNEESVVVSPKNTTAVVSDKAGTTLVRIERTIDYALDISLPAHGFQLTYTNTSAVIYAYAGMQSRLCGLCGDYNLETFGELKNPKGLLVNSARDFGLSYSISEETCVHLI